ncbi:fatty acid desaturase-domain-containing protein [Pterulicium gracile]|uniref:Delta 8-(E)-sphingolipid desaturase n=1 Tax=Pterulicium gracile TaxID=1884261 RepID=A0A5C3QPD4_9AGAR|nr:fatty acid desaturase-domain-containing protein [Pterula gracilis]
MSSASQPQPHATATASVIPFAILQKACTKDRTWVVVDEKVYDLTKFCDRHPGGSDIISIAAGKDVSALFDSYHGSRQRQILHKYLIGDVMGNDTPTFPPPDGFSRTVRKRAEEYFRSNNIDPKHSPASWVRYGCTVLLVAGLYTWQWHLPADSFWLFYLVAALYGFTLAQYAMSAFHDASHGAIGHNINLWKVLRSGHDLLLGTSSLMWTYQHVLSHHVFTNVDGHDTDIKAAKGGYRRIKTTQQYLDRYKLQYIYAPILYVLLGVSVRINDVGYLLAGSRGPLKINPLSNSQKLLFWGGKLFFFTTRILVPILLRQPVRRVLGAFFVADFVCSFFLAIVFQATHVVGEVAWPQVDEQTGNVNMDWGRLQVETAQDYAHGQPITTLLSGSLNYQAVHHLFPNVAQEHLVALAPIVRNTAEEFGVRYIIKDTLWNAIGGHIGLLKMMGEAPHSLDG